MSNGSRNIFCDVCGENNCQMYFLSAPLFNLFHSELVVSPNETKKIHIYDYKDLRIKYYRGELLIKEYLDSGKMLNFFEKEQTLTYSDIVRIANSIIDIRKVCRNSPEKTFDLQGHGVYYEYLTERELWNQ